MSTFASPSFRIHYQDVGSGQPIVLVHCWPQSHWVWQKQVDALSAAGFRCIAYDRRGFGESDKPDTGYDYDTLTADLHDLIIGLDLRNVILAGYSMGGGEVVRYLSTYGSDRIAKAMLISTVLPFPMQTPDNPEGAPMAVYDGLMAQIRADRDGFVTGLAPAFLGVQADASPEAAEMIATATRVARMASIEATAECVRAFGTTDFRAELAQITVPVLVVHGTADVIVPYEGSSKKVAALIPQSRTVLIEGAPHGLSVTHAAQLSAAMVEFAKS
jgi:non-heme chloroperoxidase